MNRIKQAFAGGSKLLSIYAMAGYPEKGSLLQICRGLTEGGAGMIEIGFPFSDPIADGPVIQLANHKALANGMNLTTAIEQAGQVRLITNVPIIMMGSLNPILSYGPERFAAAASRAGVDGVILPDLPLEEYLSSFREIFAAHGLQNVFLVTSDTAESRIREMDNLSEGFLYAVSKPSITGGQLSFGGHEIAGYLERLAGMRLRNPVMVGFGIHDGASFREATAATAGGIIGSAFIRTMADAARDSLQEAARRFVSDIKGGPI